MKKAFFFFFFHFILLLIVLKCKFHIKSHHEWEHVIQKGCTISILMILKENPLGIALINLIKL